MSTWDKSRELYDEVAELRGEVAELRSEIAELHGEIAELCGEIAELGATRAQDGRMTGRAIERRLSPARATCPTRPETLRGAMTACRTTMDPPTCTVVRTPQHE